MRFTADQLLFASPFGNNERGCLVSVVYAELRHEWLMLGQFCRYLTVAPAKAGGP